MAFKKLTIHFYLFSAFILNLTAEKTETKRRVMAWVAPYAVEISNKRLNESYSGIGMKDGLTHLGLQFWSPTKEVGLQLVKGFNVIDDKVLLHYQRWAKENNVKLMLCIYNGATQQGWDWELAKSAFETHREKIIDSLVAEILRLNLDGVDIDFEGKGNFDKDKEYYIKFIRSLSKRLKENGKELTIDSFSYKWHAPNQTWWNELLPHIDGLHVMGYSESGANAKGWRSYNFLKEAAGKYPEKLLIGVPSNKSEWQNTSASEHIDWIKNDQSVGLAIWDTQLKDASWRTNNIWMKISTIKRSNKIKHPSEP